MDTPRSGQFGPTHGADGRSNDHGHLIIDIQQNKLTDFYLHQV